MRRTSLLDRIYHASPCAVSWDSMSGDDRVRFCGHCGQHVYNFSTMRRNEAERLIQSTDGKLCAHFLRRSDGSVITRGSWTPVREWTSSLRRAASAAISTVLGFGAAVASAQNQPCKMPDFGRTSAKLSYSETAAARFATVAGTVRDVLSNGIDGTSVELIQLGTDKKYAAVANKEGVFSLDEVEPGLYAVRVETPGFVTYRAEEVRLRAGEELRLEVDLAVGSVGGCALVPASGSDAHWAHAVSGNPSRRGTS